MDNFEVVRSQIQHKSITMHTHTQCFVELFIFTSLHRFRCCLSEAHSIDLLNTGSSTFGTSFLMLGTINHAIDVLYFSAMTVNDDPASIDLIISSFLPIVKANHLHLAFSAILRTALKFNSLQHREDCTCTVKPKPCSDNRGFI